MTDESLFSAALALPPAARPAFLAARCPDPAVRKQVEDLLAAADASNPLDRPPPDLDRTNPRPSTASAESTAAVGDRVGPYKLLEKIGEGGMGEVWVADQQEPIKRRVALKLIKPGMDSRSVLGRFEAERQALAVMDHPHIARVLDAGTTADGRPYFVMELVKGTPITEFADARKLSPKQRLELFVPVCQAIQHAHMKGIIHRDIKPSNVLMALHDETPVPKVIDFGVAKAVGQQLTDKTIYTGFGALVGTPAYMAPEQAAFNQLDIDTRADVYALGVLLYELLAGSPPIDKERLRKAALDEMLRMVREEEPPRPSHRLSTSQAKATIAATRGSEPAKLSALMKGELDWIVMKALEKDRTRRYETANGFAADIQRYLSGEQVQAVPPSLGYRLRKVYRRNRAVVWVAAAFALVLATAAVVSSWLAVRAMNAEAVAEEKRQEAEASANAEKQSADQADKLLYQAMVAKADAEFAAARLQVDFELVECQKDSRVGVLRLAKMLRVEPTKFAVRGPDGVRASAFVNPEGRENLNEFVTAAVLATGQQFALFLPPITHDGQAVIRHEMSPDAKTLLTFGADGTARLWDMRTGKSIAILRQGNERVVNCGFSSDGRTAFTDDRASVARFWDVPSGRLRAETAPRANRYGDAPPTTSDYWRDAARIGGNRLVTKRYVHKELDGGGREHGWEGPAELWDTETGRLLARLDGPDTSFHQFNFMGNGRWIVTYEGLTTILILSADDGRVIGRLIHPASESVSILGTSPSGRRLATSSGSVTGERFLRLWDTRNWQDLSSMRMPLKFESAPNSVRFLNDDVIACSWLADIFEMVQVCRIGQTHPIAEFVSWTAQASATGDRVHVGDGRVFDGRTWQQLRPPSGRRYHPDLAQFATDGRFVQTFTGGLTFNRESLLVDLRTQKQLPFAHARMGHLSGLGLISAEKKDGVESVEIRLIPTAHLDLPPKALELWAQVAVRGELGPEGEFVKWNEATWEKKRQELAAINPPHPDVPFPGYLATDKLHWLRAEFGEAKTEAEQLRWAAELLRRAELLGEKAEAVRWREVQKRTREVLPPPRADK